jgi:Zn-dependent protease
MTESVWPKKARLFVHTFQVIMSFEFLLIGPYLSLNAEALELSTEVVTACQFTACMMLGGVIGSFAMLRHPPRTQKPLLVGVLLLSLCLTTLTQVWASTFGAPGAFNSMNLALLLGNLVPCTCLALAVRELKDELFGG